jgi:uncharacterized membrane protein YkoI
MKSLVVFVLLVPCAAWAANLDCSIKASKTTRSADLAGMAKVSEDAAKKTALDRVNAAGATIAKGGGLEVEDGCLVYSYDIKVPGKSGVQELLIDAGNGKVLSVEHETPAKEAAERAVPKAKP